MHLSWSTSPQKREAERRLRTKRCVPRAIPSLGKDLHVCTTSSQSPLDSNLTHVDVQLEELQDGISRSSHLPKVTC